MKTKNNPLFFVSYEPKRMIVRTACMSNPAELAHRRLCDWTWAHGYPPPNHAPTLVAICQCPPDRWPLVRAELRGNGWVPTRRSFSHPEAVGALRQARAAYRAASRRGRRGAAKRWQAHATPEPPAAKAAKRENAPAMPKQSSPNAPAMPNPCASNGNNDQRLTNKESRSKNKDSLSGKTAERSTFSSSSPEGPATEENSFLSNVLQTLTAFDARQASKELTNWGGWWRLRFREDPAKARRVLAEVASMIREKRIRSNAGAAAKDLWGRFA